MDFFSRLSFILLISVVLIVQTNGVAGNSISVLAPETNSILAEPPIAASTCPTASTISPCTCKKSSSGMGLIIDCSGSSVDQTDVENSFRQLRRVNGIPEDRGFSIYQFTMVLTRFTEFDLAPFYGSQLGDLYFSDNSKLTKLVTSGNPQDHGSIHADQFLLIDARLNGDEFADALKYFSLEMTQFYASYITINNNNNSNIDEGEFLPGLSAFVNLEYLYIQNCNISGRLNSSHLNLKAFPKLGTISLSYNEIDEIGENVFPSNVSSIGLQDNKLSETSFHPNSGIAQTGNGTELHLEHNQLTTLPSEIFQTFLDAHPQNKVYLMGNPLFCDERLSWIKAQREEFQYRVSAAFCTNDEGHTVFNSDLIP